MMQAMPNTRSVRGQTTGRSASKEKPLWLSIVALAGTAPAEMPCEAMERESNTVPELSNVSSGMSDALVPLSTMTTISPARWPARS